MAFNAGLFHEIPASPRRSVYSDLLVETISDAVPAGGSVTLGGNATGDWIIASKSLVALHLRCSSVTLGVTVWVQTSAGDISYNNWLPLVLLPSEWLHFANLFIPSWKCRFVAVNEDTVNPQSVSGMIKIQAI